MMKRFLILALAMISMLSVEAQQKRIKQIIIDDDESMTFSYNDSGQLTTIDGMDTYATVSYGSDEIIINEYDTDDGSTYTNTYRLEGGLLVSMDDGDTSTFTYSNNHLVRFDQTVSGSVRPLEFVWSDGNIVETNRYRNGNLETKLLYTYGNETAHPMVRALFESALDVLGWPDAFVCYNYLGTIPANLVTRIDSGSDSKYYTFEYETDADGDVVTIREYGNGRLLVTFNLVWEDDVTSVGNIRSEVNGVAACYTLNGYEVEHPANGVNIVRQADGKMRKVIVDNNR